MLSHLSVHMCVLSNLSHVWLFATPWTVDGWMASLTQWTWIWASSGSWWWTGKPGVLQSFRLQRVRHNWATELNWTCQAFLSVGFSRQEYWSGLSCRPPGESSWARDWTHVSCVSCTGRRVTTSTTWKAHFTCLISLNMPLFLSSKKS